MTQQHFVADLEQELRLRGQPFHRAEVLAFVRGAWPWIDEDPCVARWAAEFDASVGTTRRPGATAIDSVTAGDVRYSLY